MRLYQSTVIDPIAWKHPWTVTLPYKRLTTLDRIIHGDCAENERDVIVNGKEIVTPR